jgi:nucleotide-binding universal stress UspA family protein
MALDENRLPLGNARARQQADAKLPKEVTMTELSVKSPYRSVIVATDGSHLSRSAIAGGALLALQTKAELQVFHVATNLDVEQAVLAQAAEVLGNLPYKMVVRDVHVGSTPAEMIGQFASEFGEEAIVAVGTHGRGGIGLSILGSTAMDLLTRQGRPTVAYGPGTSAPIEVARVVACVDGSDFSELSLSEASRWATALAAPLWLIQVIPPDLRAEVGAYETTYVHNLAKELAGVGQGIEWDVLHATSPAESILDMYGNDAGTMLVMATHGRTGLQRMLLGSVATEVVRGAWGPVVMVCPPQ